MSVEYKEQLIKETMEDYLCCREEAISVLKDDYQLWLHFRYM